MSYGVRRTRKLIDRCRREYNYDLRAMVRDLRGGEAPKSLPIRILQHITR